MTKPTASPQIGSKRISGLVHQPFDALGERLNQHPSAGLLYVLFTDCRVHIDEEVIRYG